MHFDDYRLAVIVLVDSVLRLRDPLSDTPTLDTLHPPLLV
jgi:hypothetical protein